MKLKLRVANYVAMLIGGVLCIPFLILMWIGEFSEFIGKNLQKFAKEAVKVVLIDPLEKFLNLFGYQEYAKECDKKALEEAVKRRTRQQTRK